MRSILLFSVLVNAVCFGQKNESYLIKQELFLGNKLANSKSTYVTVSSNKTLSKQAFPLEINTKAITYTDPERQFIFSSLYPDSSLNVLYSSMLADVLMQLHQPIYFNFQGEQTIVDTTSLKKEIRVKAQHWELTDDVAAMVANNMAGVGAALSQELNHAYINKDFLKRLQVESQLVDSKRYSMTKSDKQKVYLTFKDTSKQLEGELVIAKKGCKLISLNQRQTYTFDNRPVLSTTNIQQLETIMHPTYDETYAEMLLSSSFVSKKLLTDGAVDSVKVVEYIKKYDAIFPNDKFFVQKKLNLLQQIKDDKQYDLTLKNTPVNLLAGTHHLSNLLYRGELSKDKFMALIPLLDKEKKYNWIQNSLYQGYAPSKEYLSASEQIELLLNGFSELEKQYIYPMVLWQRIEDLDNDLPQSRNLFNELMGLNADYWTNGNAGRYALMIYQRMVPIDEVFSRQMLNDIIAKLTTLYDTDQTKDRHITRAHLATAYYFAYQLVHKNDRREALAYLEKAALYSPKKDAEIAYDSYYDTNLLKAQNNYSEDYLTELASTGQKDVALSKYIKEFLTVQGTSYRGLRDFYQHYYSDQKFSEFFMQKVVSQLPEAPNFILKNLQNGQTTNDDLKGKWTLVDFWGTWCGPCVAEMPKLNDFYDQLRINKERSQRIGFVSIACSDTEDKVKNFIAKNNYTIPVLMSDNRVERDFNVQGYPSKYILTPEGKLIAMPFGFDWQQLLEEIAFF